MARYRLKQAAFIGGRYRKVGEVVEYVGSPAPYMEPEAAKEDAIVARGKTPKKEEG